MSAVGPRRSHPWTRNAALPQSKIENPKSKIHAAIRFAFPRRPHFADRQSALRNPKSAIPSSRWSQFGVGLVSPWGKLRPAAEVGLHSVGSSATPSMLDSSGWDQGSAPPEPPQNFIGKNPRGARFNARPKTHVVSRTLRRGCSGTRKRFARGASFNWQPSTHVIGAMITAAGATSRCNRPRSGWPASAFRRGFRRSAGTGRARCRCLPASS